MTHLSRDELLDALEGGVARRDHVDGCPACQREIEELSRVLRDAASIDIPEPSPLFWDHFSDRVSTAARGAAPVESGFGRVRRAVSARGWLPPLAAATGLIVVVALVVSASWRSALTPQGTIAKGGPRESSRVAAVDEPTIPIAAVEGGDEESWDAFVALAMEEGGSESDVVPPPGEADRAVLQLSDEECGELIRLLRTEVSGAVTPTEG